MGFLGWLEGGSGWRDGGRGAGGLGVGVRGDFVRGGVAARPQGRWPASSPWTIDPDSVGVAQPYRKSSNQGAVWHLLGLRLSEPTGGEDEHLPRDVQTSTQNFRSTALAVEREHVQSDGTFVCRSGPGETGCRVGGRSR